MPKITVLMPVYNEQENLRPLVFELVNVLHDIGETYEIIAVDDGSTDGSRNTLLALSRELPQLKLIFFRANTGQTAALDAGFRAASGQYIVTMDADRQNDPRDIGPMLNLLEQGYDCVMGYRHDRKDGLVLRKVPSKIANWIIRKIWKSKLNDLGCAVKVFRKEVSDELRLYGEMHRFIGILMESIGAKVVEYKVNHRPRVAGKSKYNLTRAYKVVLDLTTLWFLKGYRTKPIYLFGGAGCLLTTGSFLAVCWVLFDKYGLGVQVHRNPLFIVAIFLAVLALQFIVLGLLAELLIRTYYESTKQIPYSILQMKGFELNTDVVLHRRNTPSLAS